MTDPVVQRQAARVLLCDSTDCFLLIHGWDPAVPGTRYWFTPGGGLERGESELDAAIRELYEETGLRLLPEQLTGPLHRQTVDIPFDGVVYRQNQVFFAARIDELDPQPAAFDEDEARSIEGYRWWQIDDVELSSHELFYPVDLTSLLRLAIRTLPATS